MLLSSRVLWWLCGICILIIWWIDRLLEDISVNFLNVSHPLLITRIVFPHESEYAVSNILLERWMDCWDWCVCQKNLTWKQINLVWKNLKMSWCFDIILYRLKLVQKCLVPVNTEGVWICALCGQVLKNTLLPHSCVIFYISIFIYNLQVSNTTEKTTTLKNTVINSSISHLNALN